MTLKSFPRGGKKIPENKSSDSLFNNDAKVKKKNHGRKEEKKEENVETLAFGPEAVDKLTYLTLTEGLIVLGCIFEATEYHLLIDLPGGLRGQCQITDICESYTNLLQNLIKSEDTQTSEFKPLPHLYSRGDYVVCYVKAKRPEEKWQIALSLEPKLINQNFNITHLVEGLRMVCTVSSIEDHGCVVETGLTNARGFIPSKEMDGEIFPGKQLLCYIRKIKTIENTSTITLSNKENLVKAVCKANIKSLDSLMPGTNFNLHFDSELPNGICVKFAENSIGFVNLACLDDDKNRIETLTGTLLYISPIVKYAYFSCTINKPKHYGIKPGDIFEDARVVRRQSGGIILQLTRTGVRGVLPLSKTGSLNNIDPNKVFIPGSIQKCRILYNWMDGTHVCTMEQSVLQEKYFSLSDYKPGDIVYGTVTSISKENLMNLQVGKFVGQVSPEHISDYLSLERSTFKVGDSMVKARVLSVNTARNRLYLTLKESLINSQMPILCDVNDAKIGSKYHGTVIRIHKRGILVKFFGDIKGWIPCSNLNKEFPNTNWDYSIGQTILVEVESIEKNSGKINLNIANKKKRKECLQFNIGEEVEGTIFESSTQGVYLRISRNSTLKDTVTGFLPAGHMSPCMETGALLASKCIPGDNLSALVFSTANSLILTRTFLTQGKHKLFENLEIGDCIPCSIKDLEPNGVRVILPIEGCPLAYVSYGNVSNFNQLHVHQIVFAKIISINRKLKLLDLTLSLKKIHDGLPDPKSRMMAAVDTLTLYFGKLRELSNNSFYENRPISSVRLGQKVSGKITKITDAGLVVELQNNLQGTVSKDHFYGEKKVGDEIACTIIWKNFLHEIVHLTALPLVMRKIGKQNQEVEVIEGKLYRGTILMVTNWFVLILLKYYGKGILAAMPVRRHMNDLSPDLTPYCVNRKVRCYILLYSTETNIMPICMVKSAFEKKYCKEDRKDEKATKKRKKVTEENVPATKKIKIEEDESQKECKEELKKEIEEKPRVPECGFFWDNTADISLIEKKELSSDSEDEKEPESKKKKKLSAAEHPELKRQEEWNIRNREPLTSDEFPTSADQFDRLVAANPDNAKFWLQYIAFHLQTTEVEKARSVAREAVKTINYKEDKGKLSVWNAWLSMESKHGTLESLNDVFQEAVKTSDPLKIYRHMLTIHVEAGRQLELKKTVSKMIGKFKQNPEVWIECGEAYLKIGLKNESRYTMQRALQSLPISQHVNLMVRFAIMENKFGDKEKGQTLFEQILTSYPKRVNIWFSYVDSLVKSNDVDLARNVLERAIVQTLPPKKMKALYKKFISFEEQHGSKEDVARVMQMAEEYVEKQCDRNT